MPPGRRARDCALLSLLLLCHSAAGAYTGSARRGADAGSARRGADDASSVARNTSATGVSGGLLGLNGFFSLCQSFITAGALQGMSLGSADLGPRQSPDDVPPLKMVHPPRTFGSNAGSAQVAATGHRGEEESSLFSDYRPLLGCDVSLLFGDTINTAADTAGAGASLWDSLGAGGIPGALSGGPGIVYHGGAVMSSAAPTTVHFIWYGSWGTPDARHVATTLLPFAVQHASGTPYMRINEQYYDQRARAYVGSGLAVGSQVFLSDYKYGKALTDEHIQAIVADALALGASAPGQGLPPADETAIYAVLTSADVALVSGFCTSYCGWHSFGKVQEKHLRYLFVGDAARCPTACSSLTPATAPNGHVGADAMASILMHEIVEVLTDPDLDACVAAQAMGYIAWRCCHCADAHGCFCAPSQLVRLCGHGECRQVRVALRRHGHGTRRQGV
jgi:hypothetical protein